MKSLYYVHQDINTDINKVNLSSFPLTENQEKNFTKLLKFLKNRIIEISANPFGINNTDSYTLVITYKTTENMFNQYILSPLKLFENKELKPSYEKDILKYKPIQINDNDILVYRNGTLQEDLIQKEIILKNLIKKFDNFISFDYEHSIEEDKNMYELWYSLSNEERLFIFINLNKDELEKYNKYKDYANYYISFDYPININEKWYGYHFLITHNLHPKYAYDYFHIIPICYEDVGEYFENDEITVWRNPILGYMFKLRNVPELSTVGTQSDIIIPYHINKNPIKGITCTLNIDFTSNRNSFVVYKEIQDILKDIMII